MEAACSLPYIYPDPLEKSRFFLQVFFKDVKVKKSWLQGKAPSCQKMSGSNILEFSQKSRSNLLHTCRNSGHEIKSQICLTYHESWSEDGKQVKKDINNFSRYLSRKFSDLHYLWVLEFQERTAPHFHFFSDIPTKPEFRVPFRVVPSQRDLAELWVLRVQKLHLPGAITTLDFHSHEKNFFDWQMKSGSYLTKEYIEKSIQKDVPENFKNVGRFWGASRNMKPRFDIVDPETTQDPLYVGVITRAVRALSKKADKDKDQRIANAKDLLKSRLQEIGRKQGVDSQDYKDTEKRLKDFQSASARRSNRRKKVVSYTLALATPLFFRFMDCYHQAGRFFNPDYIPF